MEITKEGTRDIKRYPSHPTWNDQHRWRVGYHGVYRVLKQVYPYLIVKKQKAKLVIDHYDKKFTKKTMHELAKEFPDKTYRELEKYRDADRQQEAQQIITQQENEESKENQHKVIKNLPEQNTVIMEGFPKEIDYHRYWKDMYEKEKKKRQEAETETILIKGIGMNSPEMKSLMSEVTALKQQLHTDRDEYQKNLDKVKKENNDLYNRLAKLVDPAETVKKARESGLWEQCLPPNEPT